MVLQDGILGPSRTKDVKFKSQRSDELSHSRCRLASSSLFVDGMSFCSEPPESIKRL